MNRYAIGMIGAFSLTFWTLTAEAAPIGVPAATTGAGKTAVGVEVNLLVDRDLTGTDTNADSTQAYATGSIGLDNRVDLLFRLGFADYTIEQPGTDINGDVGPAFGAGVKTTWITLPQSHLKIGTVFQATFIRSEDNSISIGFNEYDAALGVALDIPPYRSVNSKQSSDQLSLVPYGGLAWSGLDFDGAAIEDNSFGLFLGLQAKTGNTLSFGAEIRLIDQTALGLNLSVAL